MKMTVISSIEVPDSVKQYRLKICDEFRCPFFLRAEKKSMSRCGDCGCFVYVKSGLKDFTCPQGKW